MATPTIPMWAHVTDDLWVATLGAVHLGRVEQRGEQYVAVDFLNSSIGSFRDNLCARDAVTARTDAAVAYSESGAALSASTTTSPRRTVVTVLLALGVLLVAGATVGAALLV